MNQFLAIAKNTCLQTIRQPLYGIIIIVTLGGLALAPALTGWTLDDDNDLLRDIGLSTLLIQGLFLACFAASTTLDTEIVEKTVLTVASKPVGRPVFILGKYAGLLAALFAAHLLAGLAFYMAMRHGVLQTAADKSDAAVLMLGPGVMLLVVIAATTLNYIFDWRFLPTLVALALPAMVLSTGVLLLIDRDWKLNVYETTQDIAQLPVQAEDPAVFKGIISFRPNPGQSQLAGHSGMLVHNDWKGPITDEQYEVLAGVSDSLEWQRNIDFLTTATRKRQGTEILKASLSLLVAIAMLGAFAMAATTRWGMMPTFLLCLVLLCAGLTSDQVIKPYADAGNAWAAAAYRAVPNFQVFWLVDALSDKKTIPWSYLPSALAYGALWIGAALALAMSLFETREVG